MTTEPSEQPDRAPSERFAPPEPPATPAASEGDPTPAFFGEDFVDDSALTQRPRSDAGRRIGVGLAFLAPNILGFLAFTLIPLIASLWFAFTDWDLKEHNRYLDEQVGSWNNFQNFFDLFKDRDFLRYFGNTLFFMIGIPFSIAASLAAALLLSRDLKGDKKKGTGRGPLFGVAFLFVGIAVAISFAAWATGGGSIGTPALIVCVTALILLGGVMGGQTVYRTLFYLPHFTSGVATYILWKKLFNPEQGPFTVALNPVMSGISKAAVAMPPGLTRGLAVLCVVAAAGVLWVGMKRLRAWFHEGDLGAAATVVPFTLLLVPAALALFSYNALAGDAGAPGAQAAFLLRNLGGFLTLFAGLVALLTLASFLRRQELRAPWMEGFGSAVVLAAALMVVEFVLLGLAGAFAGLPEAATQAAANNAVLEPPKWLSDPRWVKPSLMLVGFWGAVGSNTMLLYLAALTNVPGELYEAADIDGASGFQRFWNVTWPQLAPTTFFVVVMGVIGGLQGGFEMVRTMTTPPGGPGGASTTLAFDVYQKGFELGRVGYASGVAWAMFAIIFVVTLFNWTFGNKYVND